MAKRKQLPAWYKIYIEKRIQKLEKALSYLNLAEISIQRNYPYTAKAYFELTKEYIK